MKRKERKKESGKIWTVKDVISWTVGYFEEKSVPNARVEVENIMSYVIGVNRLNLYMQLDRPMTKEELEKFKILVKRRLKREPIQYIIGKAYFWKYEFLVKKGVFIPRRDTETLVEVSIKYLRGKESPLILDVGTGSGCILLSIVKDLHNVKGVGVDISKVAMEVFNRNRKKLLVEDRAFGVIGNIFGPFREEAYFDAIISNPPYVKSDEVEKLQEEIVYFEPREALDGGPDGLQFIRLLVRDSYPRIKKSGFIALEVGYDQATAVKFLLERAGYKRIEVHKDLSGIDRVVVGWKL
ncbi:MAG: peptide chain release factor N(5)-glutamine methyltransferase [Thermosulfidibacteraceae bacterium]|jgi:release factor glutamine methyltransferase